MNCVVVREHGGVDKLTFEQRPTPEPGPGEVLVAMKAIGLNHLDTWVRRGVPGHTFPLPLIPSSDGAGVVAKLGVGVQRLREGDEVVVMPGVSCGTCTKCLAGEDPLCPDFAILGETRDGLCADFAVVPAANVARKPANLSMAQAAAMPLVFQTAWSMLVTRARLRPGETVLVHAGGSGVGSAAIQIARLLGAFVVATAGTPEKCARARDLGADHAIDYTAEPFADVVRRLTDRRGVDVVFEHVGAATFDGSVKCLARGGRLVTCGATTGGKVTVNLNQLFFKNLAFLGNTLGSKADLLTVLRLAGQGRLKPVLDGAMPLREVRAAHERLEARDVFGKIVLEP